MQFVITHELLIAEDGKRGVDRWGNVSEFVGRGGGGGRGGRRGSLGKRMNYRGNAYDFAEESGIRYLMRN